MLILLMKPIHMDLTVYQTQWLKEMNGAIRLPVHEEQQPTASSWSI